MMDAIGLVLLFPILIHSVNLDGLCTKLDELTIMKSSPNKHWHPAISPSNMVKHCWVWNLPIFMGAVVLPIVFTAPPEPLQVVVI